MKRIVVEMGRGALFCPATGIQILGTSVASRLPKRLSFIVLKWTNLNF